MSFEHSKFSCKVGTGNCSGSVDLTSNWIGIVDLISGEVDKEVVGIVDNIVDGIVVKMGKVVGDIINSLHFLLSPSKYGAVLQETQ